MAFAGAHNVNTSNSTFNHVGQDQYNIGTIQFSSSCLAPAFSVTSFAASLVQQAQVNQSQISELATYIDKLLNVLDAEYL